MKSKKFKPPRPVPVPPPEQEAFLSAITDSKLFTLNAVLERHTSGRPTPPDASAALNAGTLKQPTPPPAAPRHLCARTPMEVLRSVTKPMPPAQVRAYVESHYPGKEQPDFESITDAQYVVLARAAPLKRGRVISSILDTSATAASILQMQIAYDLAVLLLGERGQQAVVQHLYDEISQCSVAIALGGIE